MLSPAARSPGGARDSNDDIIHSVTTSPCMESPGPHGGVTLLCGEFDTVFLSQPPFTPPSRGGWRVIGSTYLPTKQDGERRNNREQES